MVMRMSRRTALVTLGLAVLFAFTGGTLARLHSIFLVPLAKEPTTIRVAVIGAASITPNGILYPARRVPSVSVVSIAARSAARAEALARRWGVPKHGTYEDILSDRDVDAVYIGVITGAHHKWAAAALRAGKHVLCEKPLTSNAEEARELARLARQRSLVLMEAYHNLHHPLTARMYQLANGGELGRLRHLEITAGLPSPGAVLGAVGLRPRRRPDKMNPSLGGGKFLSQGCYAVSLARFLYGSEPQVLNASMAEDERGSRADISTAAALSFGRGRLATLRHSSLLPGFNVVATFDNGSFAATNFLFPFVWHALRVEGGGRPSRVEKHYTFDGDAGPGESTFALQLHAFAQLVRRACRSSRSAPSAPPWSNPVARQVLGAVGPQSAVQNMAVLDAIYSQAGLGRRGLSA
jgi:predicted dehydrogenase